MDTLRLGLCPYLIDLGVNGEKRSAEYDVEDLRRAAGVEFGRAPRPHPVCPPAPAPVPAEFRHEQRPPAGHPTAFARHNTVFDERGQRESMRSIIRMLQHISGHFALAVQPVWGGTQPVMDGWSFADTHVWWQRRRQELDVARDMMPGFVYTVPFDATGSEFRYRLMLMEGIIQRLTPHADVLQVFTADTADLARKFLTE